MTLILDQSKDGTIYTGGSITNPTLVINNLAVKDIGIYRCFVENKFGLGRGEDISVMVQPGLCDITCYHYICLISIPTLRIVYFMLVR